MEQEIAKAMDAFYTLANVKPSTDAAEALARQAAALPAAVAIPARARLYVVAATRLKVRASH